MQVISINTRVLNSTVPVFPCRKDVNTFISFGNCCSRANGLHHHRLHVVNAVQTSWMDTHWPYDAWFAAGRTHSGLMKRDPICVDWKDRYIGVCLARKDPSNKTFRESTKTSSRCLLKLHTHMLTDVQNCSSLNPRPCRRAVVDINGKMSIWRSRVSWWQVEVPSFDNALCQPHLLLLWDPTIGGHFGKWPPQPSEVKFAMPLYPDLFIILYSSCVPNLVLLSKSAQSLWFFELCRPITSCECFMSTSPSASLRPKRCPTPCLLTQLNGGLSQLHSADDAAIAWLTNYGS